MFLATFSLEVGYFLPEVFIFWSCVLWTVERNIWKDSWVYFKLSVTEYLGRGRLVWGFFFRLSQQLSLTTCFPILWGDLTCKKCHCPECCRTQVQCYFRQIETFMQKSYKWNHFRILFTTIHSYLQFIVKSLKYIIFLKKRGGKKKKRSQISGIKIQ